MHGFIALFVSVGAEKQLLAASFQLLACGSEGWGSVGSHPSHKYKDVARVGTLSVWVSQGWAPGNQLPEYLRYRKRPVEVRGFPGAQMRGTWGTRHPHLDHGYAVTSHSSRGRPPTEC